MFGFILCHLGKLYFQGICPGDSSCQICGREVFFVIAPSYLLKVCRSCSGNFCHLSFQMVFLKGRKPLPWFPALEYIDG